jgi:hypothetical protein
MLILINESAFRLGDGQKVPEHLELAYQANCAALSARSAAPSYLGACLAWCLLKTILAVGYAKMRPRRWTCYLIRGKNIWGNECGAKPERSLPAGLSTLWASLLPNHSYRGVSSRPI